MQHNIPKGRKATTPVVQLHRFTDEAAGGSAPGEKVEAAGCSPSPSQSRQQAQLANSIIGILAEWYAAAFFVYERRRKPLKLGIDHDINVACAGAITVAELKAALRLYCGNVGYLRACTKPGAPRYDLSGNVAGKVSDDEAAHACQRLAARVDQHKSPSPSPAVPRIGFAELRAAAHARRAASLTGASADARRRQYAPMPSAWNGIAPSVRLGQTARWSSTGRLRAQSAPHGLAGCVQHQEWRARMKHWHLSHRHRHQTLRTAARRPRAQRRGTNNEIH